MLVILTANLIRPARRPHYLKEYRMSSPVSIVLRNDEGRIVDCMSWLFKKPHRVEVKQQRWKSHSACQDVHLRKHLEVVKNSHNGTLEESPVELCMHIPQRRLCPELAHFRREDRE